MERQCAIPISTVRKCIFCLDTHAERECPSGVICFNCFETGHMSRDCIKFGMELPKCKYCRKKGHEYKTC